MDQILTDKNVKFVMLALLEGRIDGLSACRLVKPWVEEASELMGPNAEFGAQLIHGFDITLNSVGLHVHGVWPLTESGFFVPAADLISRARSWLRKADSRPLY